MILGVSDLNLATQPFVNRRRFYVLSTVSAVALSLTLVVLSFAFAHNFRSERGMRRDLRKVRDELAAVDAQQKSVEDALALPQAADLIDRNDFLNGLIRQKAVSWTRIFMDLEQLMPDRVQTVALHPVVKGASATRGAKATAGAPMLLRSALVMDLQMQVSGENFQDLLDLLRRIAKSQNFRDPVVQGENGPVAGSAQPIATRGEDRLYGMTFKVEYAQ